MGEVRVGCGECGRGEGVLWGVWEGEGGLWGVWER